ncbi:hypothetical protein HPB47_025135 [Ixodes persulcatus]|uniref:Uncharacterized protein n=1 Tax=Ixodes persulcatus TaxID=34615 RepID=A0AC60Q4S7_IXOPE|nr:hypothetical protein HPB47_025135 [Ixodes persulcatus]
MIDDQSTGAESNHGRLRLRRSDVRHIERARNRTLRLTIVIVLAFFLCWTPYVIMVLWYQFDPEGAEHVDGYLQSSLFMFAVSNSCVNPLVYGSYTATFEKRCCGQAASWCWVLGNVRGKENYKLSKQPSKQTVNSWVARTPQCKQRELQKDWCSACSSEVYDLRSVLDKNETGYCQSHVELTRSTTKLCRCSVDSVVLVLPSAETDMRFISYDAASTRDADASNAPQTPTTAFHGAVKPAKRLRHRHRTPDTKEKNALGGGTQRLCNRD